MHEGFQTKRNINQKWKWKKYFRLKMGKDKADVSS